MIKRRFLSSFPGAGHPTDVLRAISVPSDDDEHRSGLVAQLLADRNRDLLIAEPPCWQDDSVMIDGHRYGRHALAAYFSLLVLRIGGVLAALQRGGGRKLVWHVGPSGGALARALHTLVPDCTQIVSGEAGALARMADAIGKAVPGCSVMMRQSGDHASFDSWPDHDFIFSPVSALANGPVPGPDLVVDLFALQAMGSEQATGELRHAHDLGGRFVYSVSARASESTHDDFVQSLIGRFYWPHRVSVAVPPEVFATEHGFVLQNGGSRQAASGETRLEFVFGWRKIGI